MNLYQFIDTIKQVATAHKDIAAFNDGDVYETMNSGQHIYPSVVLSISNMSATDNDGYQTISCVLFYIDRLTDDSANKTMIWSQGYNVLKQLKDRLSESLAWNFDTANYTPFTEKFQDLCAGVYAETNITLQDDIICSDTGYAVQQLDVTRNGLYSTIGYDTVLVAVPDPVLNTIEIKTNGTYEPEAPVDGYDKVVVEVPDPELEDIRITSNGNYRSEKYGFSDVIVDVPLKPTQEKTADITQNGTTDVTPDEGYDLSKVTVNVNVPDPELEELSVTSNGTYTPDKYGYSKVDVNVPDKPVRTLDVYKIENGKWEYASDETFNYDKVTVEVAVPDKPTQEKILNLTENGRTIVIPDDGYTLRGVDVTVDVPPTPTQAKSVVYEKNGEFNVYPDEGRALSKVEVTVDVPDPVIEDIDITKNGRYIPDEGVDGFGIVNVAIPVEQKKQTVTENNSTTVISATQDRLMDKVTVNVAIPTEKKTETLTENNKTVTIKPETGKLIDSVEVTTAIPTESPVVEIVQNNTTEKISNNTGLLDEVTVNVAIPTEQKTAVITKNNSSVTVTPSEGKLLDSVEVTANIPTETKEVSYTENGSYEVTPSEGKLLDSVKVNVNVIGEGLYQFERIGYQGDEIPLKADLDYAISVYDRYTAGTKFIDDNDLIYAPNVDISSMTDLSDMFRNNINLRVVPNYDTSNATDMSYMFFNCRGLNKLPLMTTTNVTNMSHMLYGCRALRALPHFDTSNVTDMSYMLYGCVSIGRLPHFDTSKVTNMSHMFAGADLAAIEQDMTWMDISKVTSLKGLFNGVTRLGYVPVLNSTANVTDMSYMFANTAVGGCTYDMSNVTDMSYMFYNCHVSYITDNMITDKVTNTKAMFYGNEFLGLDVDGNHMKLKAIETTKVTDMSYMFYGCSNIINAPITYTIYNTDMSYMFYGCNYIDNIPEMDCSKVKRLEYTFDGCYRLKTIGKLTNIGKGVSTTKPRAEYIYLNFRDCRLSGTSVSNIISGLANVRSTYDQFVINFGPNVSLLSSQKTAIANKGWRLIEPK